MCCRIDPWMKVCYVSQLVIGSGDKSLARKIELIQSFVASQLSNFLVVSLIPRIMRSSTIYSEIKLVYRNKAWNHSKKKKKESLEQRIGRLLCTMYRQLPSVGFTLFLLWTSGKIGRIPSYNISLVIFMFSRTPVMRLPLMLKHLTACLLCWDVKMNAIMQLKIG